MHQALLVSAFMNTSPRTTLILAGVLLGASFYPLPLFVGAMLGIIGSMLLASCWLRDERIPIVDFFLLGFFLNLTTAHWIGELAHRYTSYNYFLCYLFAIALCGLASAQFVVLGFIFRILNRAFLARLHLSFPLAWFIVEFVFPKLVPFYLGTSQLYFKTFAQIARLGGPYALSFLLLWWTALFIAAVKEKQRKSRVPKLLIGTLFASIVVVICYGKYNLARLQALIATARTINVVAVQPDLNPKKDYSYEMLEPRMEKLRSLTTEQVDQHSDIDLIIWPETSVGHIYYPDDHSLSDKDQRHPFQGLMIPLLFGGQTATKRERTKDPKYYNSAFLLTPDGAISQFYRKRVLFPFSEKIPLSGIFPILNKWFTPRSPIVGGDTAATMELSLKNGSKTKIAVLICFEDLFPELFSAAVIDEGANLLTVLSSNSWFSGTAAMYQHSLLSRWRAIENRRYLLRATNNGFTELISPTGEVVKSLPSLTQGSIYIEDVPLLGN